MKQLIHFLFMLHFGTGCIISDEHQMKVISGYTGGTAVLPCSCAQPQSTVPTFTWRFQRGNEWIPVFDNEKFSSRLVLFSETSPLNLSLLISDLRKEDQGYYQCMTERGSTTTILLTVKGCELAQTHQRFQVTGYSGESVVLPCSCTELLTKPEHIQWKYIKDSNYIEIYPTPEIESLKNRVKLLNQTTPGNLSLHISDLSTEDQGDYLCYVSSPPAVFFRLHVEEKLHVHTTSSSTDQPLNTRHITQEPTAPQQPQHKTQYGFILVTVFIFTVLLTFLAVSTRYARDEMFYSAAVYVEKVSAPTHRPNEQVELAEYINTNTEQT